MKPLNIVSIDLKSDGHWGMKLRLEVEPEAGVSKYDIGPCLYKNQGADVKRIPTEDGGRLDWVMDEHGLVRFGVMYEEKRKRPGHDGYWTSRAGVFNIMQDEVQVADIVINSMALSIDIKALEAILEEHAPEYGLSVKTKWEGEKYYLIKKKQPSAV